MKNKTLYVFGILILIVLVYLLFFNFPSDNVDSKNSELKEFNIKSGNWYFEPSRIEVNKGDLVRMNIQNDGGFHGISIKQFGVSETYGPNQNITIEFIADESGEFSYFCNVFCGEGHRDMEGILIVK